jgi:uncharacterized protein YbaP (TraB family)
MKKWFIALAGIIVLFSFSSCLSILASSADLSARSPKQETISVPGKEVYFVGMAHLGNKEFYDNAKTILTDFQNRGFVCYLESVRGLGEDRIGIDTLYAKKFRKLTGLNITEKYSQLSNPIMQQLIRKYKLIDQPSYEDLGVTHYTWVDYTYIDLVNLYEKRHSLIELDRCDVETGIDRFYACKVNTSDRSEFTETIILKERNKLIARTIASSKDKKIVVIYGKMHLEGIRQELAQLSKAAE